MAAGGNGGFDLSDLEIDKCIASIAASQVGGSYWGSRPPLPNAPYALVRVRDAKARAEMLKTAGKDREILVWLNSRSDRSRLPDGPIRTICGGCDPWHLLRGAVEVIVDSDDELALIAAISNVPVRCVGVGPFEAVTRGQSGLFQVLRGPLVGACDYANPFTGQSITLAEAIELCAFWRKLIDSNRPIKSAIGFASWKRPTVAPLLWSGSGDLPFANQPPALDPGDEVAIWKSRVSARQLRDLVDAATTLVEVEDGFIRSVGLGADCIPPLSIVVDRAGIYFDPQQPSDLEMLLEEGVFSAGIVARAARLRELIVESGISKYEVAGGGSASRRGERRQLLVVGQVEDDRSVQCGGGSVRTNLELLRRVRQQNPDAYLCYKPHPDVQAGHRIGEVNRDRLAEVADEEIRTGPISHFIEVADEVHVNTSLAGFEALLRGKPVTTYGVPFYAGWGLTRDLGEIPSRRKARRTLDELVAAVLLVYPRYLDPLTGLPCPAEILVSRLAEGGGNQSKGAVVRLRQLQGRLKRLVSYLRRAS